MFVHAVMYSTVRVIVASYIETNTATKVVMIIALIIKLMTDSYVFAVFADVFKYFLDKK